MTRLPLPENARYHRTPVLDCSAFTMALTCAVVSTSLSEAMCGFIFAIHAAIRAGSYRPSVPMPPWCTFQWSTRRLAPLPLVGAGAVDGAVTVVVLPATTEVASNLAVA